MDLVVRVRWFVGDQVRADVCGGAPVLPIAERGLGCGSLDGEIRPSELLREVLEVTEFPATGSGRVVKETGETRGLQESYDRGTKCVPLVPGNDCLLRHRERRWQEFARLQWSWVLCCGTVQIPHALVTMMEGWWRRRHLWFGLATRSNPE